MFSALSGAVSDFAEGLRLYPLWSALGWQQTVMRFRRTVLGPFWLSANLLAMAFALAVVFGGLFGTDFRTNLASIVAGILTWTVIGGAFGEATGVFIGASGMMTSQRLPLSFHLFLMMYRIFINFVAQLIALWALYLVMQVGAPPTWQLLIGLPTLFCASFFICLLLAIPSTRFRDIGQLVANSVSLLFFITPVFWSPQQLKSDHALATYNPLAHLLEIVREPLIGRAPTLADWEWSFSICVITGLVSVLTLAVYRKRLVFWL